MGSEGLGPKYSESPFRIRKQKPPSFLDGHFWGVMKWERKADAGKWVSEFLTFLMLGTDIFNEKVKK